MHPHDDLVTNYTPHIKPQTWDAIGPYVRDVTRRAVTPHTTNRREIRVAMHALTRHTAWCTEESFQPLTDEAIFNTEAINMSCEHGHQNLTYSVRGNMRSILRRVSRRIGVDPGPAPVIARHKLPSEPYTGQEAVTIISWARSQPTPYRQRNAQMIVALGMDAGLKTTEMAGVRAGDVTIDDDGVLVWVREGKHPRAVPVTRDLEGLVARHSHQADPGEFLIAPKRTTTRRLGVVSDFTNKYKATLPITAQRLRCTWLYRHLAGGTPIPALIHASGLEGVSGLERILPYLPEPERSTARQALRDPKAVMGL
ncbi:hypothetical protein [Kytococcus sp. Marseille-QA3725]